MSAQTTTLSKQWLPTQEFITLAGIPLRTFRLKKSQGAYLTRKRGKALEISAASLPASALVQLAPASPVVKQTPALPTVSGADMSSGPLFATQALAGAVETPGVGRRVALPKEAEAQARKRLAVLQPLIDFCETIEGRRKYLGLPLANKKPVANSNDMAQYLCEIHGIPAATLWRWKRNYSQQGLAGLARKVREDKGRAKWAEVYPAAAELVRTVFWNSAQTKQEAYNVLLREHTRYGMPRANVPSYGSVCLYLQSLPQAITTLAREGEKVHHDTMSGHITRGYTDLASNDVWVADTMLHDVLVWNDCFDNRDGAAIRVQLVAIMDVRTRKFVGYCWMLNGSSRGITSAFVQAVLKYGPPRSFYCDNGADYKKFVGKARPLNNEKNVAEDVDAIQKSGALRVMGIPVTFCKPFSPWSKNIERAFGTLHKQSDALHRHYTTGNAYLKPDATIAAAEKHGKLLKMGAHEQSPLMPASHFIRIAQDWIELHYNAGHKHSGRGMDGRTPDQVFAACMPPGAARPYDPDVLATLLWNRKQILVRRTEILLNNRPMVGATATDAAILYKHNREEVTVCFDERNPEFAVVADADGRKLCTLRAKEFAPQGPAAKPMIAASLQLHRSLRNAAAEVIRTGRRNVARAGIRSSAELMHERALSGQGVQDEPLIVQPTELKATGTFGRNAEPPRLTTNEIAARIRARQQQQ